MSSLHKELGSYVQFRGTHFPSLPRAGEFSRTLAALTGQLQEDRGSSSQAGSVGHILPAEHLQVGIFIHLKGRKPRLKAAESVAQGLSACQQAAGQRWEPSCA